MADSCTHHPVVTDPGPGPLGAQLDGVSVREPSQTDRKHLPLTLTCQSRTGRGTFGAHDHEICPEAMRNAEISTAGQSACAARSPWSQACPHETRPTDRLGPLETLRRRVLPYGRPASRDVTGHLRQAAGSSSRSTPLHRPRSCSVLVPADVDQHRQPTERVRRVAHSLGCRQRAFLS